LFSATAALYRIKNALSLKVKIAIYKSLFESLIRYGVILYGTASKGHLQRIERLQERSLVILFGKDDFHNEDRPVNLLLEARTLTPQNFYNYSILIQYFYENELKVENLKDTCIALRNIERLRVPYIRNNFGERLSRYIVPHLFNRLPPSIHEQKNFTKFKKLVYMWLVGNSLK